MAPRYNIGGAPQPQKGFIRSTYDTLTSPDNASVVRSVTAFGVRFGELSSFGSFGVLTFH